MRELESLYPKFTTLIKLAESKDEKATKFYFSLIDVVYGLIISASFLQVERIIFPLDKVFTANGFTLALGAFFAYYLILSGWYGLHRSLIDKPFYLVQNRSKVRFALNLLIIFLEYYLVALATGVILDIEGGVDADNINWDSPYWAHKAYEAFGDNYSNIFLWLIPTIYGVYTVWDFVKVIERPSRQKITDELNLFTLKSANQSHLLERWRKYWSFFTLLGFIVIAAFYNLFHTVINANDFYYNIWFIVFSLALVAFYRVYLKRYNPDPDDKIKMQIKDKVDEIGKSGRDEQTWNLWIKNILQSLELLKKK